MPHVVYVVMSHRNPGQVLRLAGRLLDGSSSSHVLLHHDPTGAPLPAGPSPPRLVSVRPRRPVRWGTSDTVHVFVDALRQAREQLDPDWLVFLSGQDYPIAPVPDIERELGSTPQDVLMDLVPVATESPWAEGEAASRYAYRYLRRPAGHPWAQGAAGLLARRGDPGGRHADDADWSTAPRFVTRRVDDELLVGVRPRRPVFGPSRRCFVGDQWFSVSRRGIADLLDADPGGALLRHYDRTIVPDESYFHTLVGNALPPERIGGARRYVRWTGEAHPELLTSRHLGHLLGTGMHFARKFDQTVDGGVLDELDRLHG